MKTRSKIGGRAGNPAYRTPALFRYRQHIKVNKAKSKSFKVKK